MEGKTKGVYLKKDLTKYMNMFIFLLLIFSISIGSLFYPIKSFSENENRYLEQKPNLNWKNIKNGVYSSKYEGFMTDQFMFRDSWIGIKTKTQRMLLKQDINSVYFAKDGYLIEKHSWEDVDDVQATKNYERLIDFLNRYEMKLPEGSVNLMLIPTDSEVLVDKLPPFTTNYDQQSIIDKAKKDLSQEIVIDPTNRLKEHSDEYIYYKTDHHWTTLGAYYAYEEWANHKEILPFNKEEFEIVKVADDFYGTLHSKVNIKTSGDSIYLYKIKKDMDYQVTYDFINKSDGLYDMSKLSGKDKYSVFFGGNHGVDEVKTNEKNGKRLLIIKDSFAHSFAPLVVNHYEHTYMIDLRYINTNIDEFIAEHEITDILVLYNVMNFVKDRNTSKLLK